MHHLCIKDCIKFFMNTLLWTQLFDYLVETCQNTYDSMCQALVVYAVCVVGSGI